MKESAGGRYLSELGFRYNTCSVTDVGGALTARLRADRKSLTRGLIAAVAPTTHLPELESEESRDPLTAQQFCFICRWARRAGRASAQPN